MMTIARSATAEQRARAAALAPLWALALATLVGLAFGVAPVSPAWAGSDGSTQVAGGVLGYLGVLPAEVLRGHPAAHPEGAMHGGVPEGRHEYHLVVALFDQVSGERLEQVQATATVMGLGHTGGTRIPLEPMAIAGTVTYGGFVELPGNDIYEIIVEVTRPGGEPPVRLEFSYQHGAH